jgi:glutathione S-transferase
MNLLRPARSAYGGRFKKWAVDFEAIPVNMLAGEHRSPAFLKVNPAGKLPVLVDGDMVLTESIAIVLYLAEKYRDKGLIPIDLQQRAQLMRWLLFTTTELEQPLWRIARHTALYPEGKRLPGELALARDDFAEMANVLEEYMNGRQFVVGDRVTVGDFVLAYTLDWAKTAKVLNGLPARSVSGGDVRAPACAHAHRGGLRQHQALSSFCCISD